jgi:hypothetical protein
MDSMSAGILHMNGIRTALVPLYRNTVNRFPFFAPLYRRILQREMRRPFRDGSRPMDCTMQSSTSSETSVAGIFFEAARNDGLLFSNTAYLEFYCDWRGLLVEAIAAQVL